MQRMSNKIYILTLVICFSCNNKKQSDEVLTENKTQIDTAEKLEAKDSLKRSYPSPIDIQEFKKSLNSFTSGVLATQDSKDFCNPDNTKFFGFYFLLGRGGCGPFGTLTISLPHKPKKWLADDPNEEFEEIKLNTNEVKVWDSVSVGMKEKDLIKFIGSNFHYKKGTTIYTELGDYSASFTIDSDTICKLKIGKYCKNKK